MLAAALALLVSSTGLDVHQVHPELRETDWFKVRVTADAALPDGIAVGLSLAPLPHVRLSVAGLTNVIGFGLRGGIQLVPFSDWRLHPIFGAEAGHYFNGNPRMFWDNGPERLSYEFANLNAGLELRLGRFELFAVGGMSRVWAHGELNETPLDLQLTLPSVKAGFSIRLN